MRGLLRLAVLMVAASGTAHGAGGTCASCTWERQDTAGHHAVVEADLATAATAFAAALDVAEGFLAGDFRLIESLRDLALVARRRDDDDAALGFETRALDAMADAGERLAFARLAAHQAMVEDLLRLGRDAETEPHRLAALAEHRTLFGADAELAVALLELAGFYQGGGRLEDATAAAEEAAAIRKSFTNQDDRPYAAALDTLSRLYVAAGRDQDAAAALAVVIAIDESHLGADHVFVAGVIEQYVPILRRLGRDDEADSLEWRAMDIRARSEAPMLMQPAPEPE